MCFIFIHDDLYWVLVGKVHVTNVTTVGVVSKILYTIESTYKSILHTCNGLLYTKKDCGVSVHHVTYATQTLIYVCYFVRVCLAVHIPHSKNVVTLHMHVIRRAHALYLSYVITMKRT